MSALKSSSKIRQQIRSQRRSLSEEEQHHNAKNLSKQIQRTNVFRYAKKVALYLSNDGEIDPSFIIQQAWNMGKQVYLPVLSPLKNQLYFSPYQYDSKMKPNRFGILEPDCNPKNWTSAQQLDVLFLPLVAFDSRGNRIGMGGGFYDRSLAYLSMRKYFRKPKLIGLAHEIQQQESLKHEKWDIPLNQIITEKRKKTTISAGI